MAEETQSRNAEERLREMLQAAPLSRRAAQAALEREGAAEIGPALDAEDWVEQARRAVREEAETEDNLLFPLLAETSLLARGFTRAETEAALADADWSVFLGQVLASARERMIAPVSIQQLLEKDGFTADQVQEALAAESMEADALCREAVRNLSTVGVSRRGLQEFLIGLGYTKEQARSAIRAEKPDWDRQALLAAENLALLNANEQDVGRSMARAGFPDEQIQTAILAVEPGETEQADRVVHHYLQFPAISAEDLRSTLEEAGYRSGVIDYVINEADAEALDWTELGAAAIAVAVQDVGVIPGGPSTIREPLAARGYSRKQIEAGLDRAQINWVQRAVQEFARDSGDRALVMDSPRSVARELESKGYSAEQAREAAKIIFKGRDEAEAALCEVRSAVWACGRDLIEQGLRDAEYSPEIVSSTMNQVFFDWNERAETALKQILQDMQEHALGVPSPRWLQRLMESRGFTPEQIEHAFAVCPPDWADAARLYASLAGSLSEAELRSALEEEAFPPDAIEVVLAGK